MPTGYTDMLKNDGVSLREFILTCARAFGACIMQRDDNISSKIVMDEVSNYHSEALLKAQQKSIYLNTATKEYLYKEFEKDVQKSIEYNMGRIVEDSALRSKYDRMLGEVEKWTPPTPEHVGLKDFMIKQILESIEWDCGGDYNTKELDRAHTLTFDEWLEDKKNRAENDIEYHTKGHAEEVLRVLGRNQWKTQLLESLE